MYFEYKVVFVLCGTLFFSPHVGQNAGRGYPPTDCAACAQQWRLPASPDGVVASAVQSLLSANWTSVQPVLQLLVTLAVATSMPAATHSVFLVCTPGRGFFKFRDLGDGCVLADPPPPGGGWAQWVPTRGGVLFYFWSKAPKFFLDSKNWLPKSGPLSSPPPRRCPQVLKEPLALGFKAEDGPGNCCGRPDSQQKWFYKLTWSSGGSIATTADVRSQIVGRNLAPPQNSISAQTQQPKKVD